MADNSAENAFLQSMQDDSTGAYGGEYNPEPAIEQPEDDDDDDEEDYDPASLMPEEDSYDPEHVAVEPTVGDTNVAPEGDQSANGTPSKKQSRTVGGFMVDDDDDEEEGSMVKPKGALSSGLLSAARASSQTPQRSNTHTPNPSLSVPANVSVPPKSPLQDQVSSSDVVANGNTDAAFHLAIATDTDTPSAQAEHAKSTPQPLSATIANSIPSITLLKGRLPHDRIGILEDRVKEDPRGDMDAWLELIGEYRRRNRIDDLRNTYDRFLQYFPESGEQWSAYAEMEIQNNERMRAESIFSRSLMKVPHIQFWTTYLNHVRRRHNMDTDSSGRARQTVSQTFEVVLENVGIDKDAGSIWQEYIAFIKSGPGNIGGTGWQDQQKMDSLRKAYQRAICIPTAAVTTLWKEYDSFEMGLNKIHGRKFLQERSPAYMTARSSNTALQNITKDLDRTTTPRLPPALGFDGDTEYAKQVEVWKKWTEWEKDDPLVLREEDSKAYQKRVLYVYRQAAMALRFWPELWYEAAEFCFSQGLQQEGDEFLNNGAVANPESCLLAFKRADRIEISSPAEGGDAGAQRRGAAVREPYDKVLDALYDLIKKASDRETETIGRVKENFTQQRAAVEPEDEDDEAADLKIKELNALEKVQIEAIEKGNAAQIKLLSRTISFVWISLMRAMRRVQGKGTPTLGGARGIFTDARKRGRLTSDVYIASALIEYHCYKDPAATKIFERGIKLFPDDENFAMEYLKHLIAINDITNARAVFETTVNRLSQKPESLHKAKPIYHYFHEYEAQYGELSQVTQLEKRMADLFPEDPQLQRFASRYRTHGFDPTAIRPIISPAVQARPKALPTIEKPPSVQNSPRPLPTQITSSPKRPLEDDFDVGQPAPKIARGESPLKGLKGAAGRRLEDQKRREGSNMGVSSVAPAPSLPREVLFLLSILPPAHSYNVTRFNPQRMLELVRNADLTNYRPPPPQSGQPNGTFPTFAQTTQNMFNGYNLSHQPLPAANPIVDYYWRSTDHLGFW